MKRFIQIAAFILAAACASAQYQPWDLVTYQIDATGTGSNFGYSTIIAPYGAAAGDVEGVQCFDPVTKVWFGMKNSAAIKIDWVNGIISIDNAALGLTQSNVSGLTSALSSKADAAAMTTAMAAKANTSSLATVATSGAYSDLSGRPSIPAAQIQADWTQGSSGSIDFIKNKPSIPAAQVQSDWNQASSGSSDFIKNKPTVQAIQRVRAQTDGSGNYTWTFPSAYGSGIVPVVSCNVETSSTTNLYNVQTVSISNTSVTVKVFSVGSVNLLSTLLGTGPSGSQAYVHLTAVAP